MEIEMTTKTKTFSGYLVELETDVDLGDGPTTQCTISKNRHWASLAALNETGVLIRDDSEIAVPDAIIARIQDWADTNGY
jgi:hypothetical protein